MAKNDNASFRLIKKIKFRMLVWNSVCGSETMLKLKPDSWTCCSGILLLPHIQSRPYLYMYMKCHANKWLMLYPIFVAPPPPSTNSRNIHNKLLCYFLRTHFKSIFHLIITVNIFISRSPNDIANAFISRHRHSQP